MSQICAKKMPAKLLVLALCTAVGLCAIAEPAMAKSRSTSKGGQQLEAPVPGAVTVSDYEFNTFVFPTAVKRIYFPAQSPVVGKPIYLAENTQVMLQFDKGSSKSVQMVVELDNNATVSLRVVPRPVPGVTHAVNGARPKAVSTSQDSRVSGAGQAHMPAPKGEDIELLKQVISSGEPPQGYDPIKLPQLTRFDKFSVVPLTGWSDGAKRIMVFSLVAAQGQTAVVAPPQFYRPGITAVMIDGDVVDAAHSPQLFVVEELNDE